MHVDVIRYEVRDSGHFTSPTGTARGGAVVIDLTQVDRVDTALAALAALGTHATDGATLHLVVPAGLPVAPRRGGVRFHDSVAAALSAARARHSPVSAF